MDTSEYSFGQHHTAISSQYGAFNQLQTYGSFRGTLIVHRAGIVDEEYNRRTCANCSIGTTLELDDRAGRIRTN